MPETTVKPERPGGFPDFLTQDYLARENMLKKIEKIFRSFGYDPVETPRIEFLRTLSGETSDTGKNIFHIKSSQDNEPLAMPFDHTVPFARILAANPYDAKKRTGIRLPWRRMVVGPVFRADTPQSGRYRQFYQFDADIAGTSSMLADAEIISMMFHTMKALSVEKFKIKLNNRKILNGLRVIANIKSRNSISCDDITREMMRILDKLDKSGLDGIIKELRAKPQNDFDPAPQLSNPAIQKIKSFINLKGSNREKLELCRNLFENINTANQGIDELEQILEYISRMGVCEDNIEIDFSIARGLDYYTGPVMETILLDAPEFGSVFSGGRYNDLVSRFTGKELPATGASIGVDRLFAALRKLKAIDLSAQTVSQVLILRIDRKLDADYLEIATKLRQAGINAEVCLLEDTTFKSQFSFAIAKGVDYVVIRGSDESDKGTVQIKNLNTRKQEEIPREKLLSFFDIPH